MFTRKDIYVHPKKIYMFQEKDIDLNSFLCIPYRAYVHKPILR